eukprot:7069923-Prymnesium_polylepis.2
MGAACHLRRVVGVRAHVGAAPVPTGWRACALCQVPLSKRVRVARPRRLVALRVVPRAAGHGQGAARGAAA